VIPVVVGSNPIIHPSFKPSFPGPLAQLVEQLTLNQLVEGSNPSRPTKQSKTPVACDRRFALCVPNGLRGMRFRVVANREAEAALGVLVLQGRTTVKWSAFV
jgi:hypothetical protein